MCKEELMAIHKLRLLKTTIIHMLQFSLQKNSTKKTKGIIHTHPKAQTRQAFLP
jgi:hypothetical protein